MPTSRFRRDEFQPALHMLEAVGWRLEEGGKQTLVGGVRFALLGGRRANSTVPTLVGNGGANAQQGCGLRAAEWRVQQSWNRTQIARFYGAAGESDGGSQRGSHPAWPGV